MMRSLAQFIMRGRLQAGIVALLSFAVPLLPLGAIGLIVLRHGAREGLLLITVALVPAVLSGLLGKSGVVVFWGTLLGLLAVYIPALFLRALVSWTAALQAALITALLTVGLGLLAIPELLAAFSDMTALFLAGLSGQALSDTLPVPSQIAVSGFMAMAIFLNGVTGLLLARWWQALLYNPGGFGREFRALRLGILSSSLCAAVVALCYWQGPDYSFWATTFAGPLMLVAIAIVHSMARQQKVNRTWLVVFYLLIIIFSQMVLVLAVIGLADSWLNIRKRLSISSES
jgi:hypothetical protein